jgi:hypothetical protein
MKDEFVSAEHYLLALADTKYPAAKFLKDSGVTRERLMQALQQVRGSQRVTDQNPEGKYQTLEKYGRDLTQAARSGHWTRQRNSAGHAGALEADEKQSGLDRRTGHGQDGDRRRASAANCFGRRAGIAEEQTVGGDGYRVDDRRGEVSRGVRRPVEGIFERGDRFAG